MTIAPANPTRPIHSALLNKLNALQTFTSPWRVMFIAAVFAIPALLGGYIQDDNYFILRYFFPAQTNQISIPSLSPYGMFTLSDGSAEQVQQLVNSALAPWWIDPHFKFSLFRPLAEWSHALDFWLWPRETLLVHLHSLVWFLALVYGATRFFQLTLGNTPVAGLAALLFALDSNLGWVNGWIASRNTLMCLALGVNAINLFIAALGGNRIKLAGGLALFSAALFSGEFALSSYAWMLCSAVFLPLKANEPKTVARLFYLNADRLGKLLILTLPLLIWAFLYLSGGYGVTGSGDYISPLQNPVRFIEHFFSQAPDTIFQEIYFIAYTLIGPAPVFSPAWLFGVGGILLFSLIFLKTDFPAKPFWIIGLLLCALPACAGSGGSRVAMFMNLALAPMVSSVIFHGLAVRNTAQRLYSWLLILFKILMLPLTLMAPIILNRFDVIYVITAAKTLPIETNDRQRTLLMLNPVSEPASRLFKIVRLWHNLPVTESQFSFASGTSSIAISRPDDKSLILTPADGFAGSQGEQFMRDIAAHPFKAGDTLSFAQVTIRVLETTADGRPASVRFEFDAELENNKFIWLQCDNERLIAWKPIAIGEHATLAACKAN